MTMGARRGFTMLELVIVVAIIAVIAAIAIPRMSSAAAGSRASALKADLRLVQGAIEMYIAEHGGLHPAQQGDGSVDPDGAAFVDRLVKQTDCFGSIGAGVFGPYLRTFPPNTFSGLRTVRVDGAAAGTGAAGWRFDSATQVFAADDSAAHALIKPVDIKAVDLD